MGEEYLVRGAVLQCQFGSHCKKLNLPIDHGVYILDTPMMHALDYIPVVNIVPFGVCSHPLIPPGPSIVLPKEGARGKDGELTGAPPSGIAKGIPCMPIVVVPWQNAHNETRLTLAEIPSITTKSFLVCMYGGIIKPLNSGQKKKENKTVVEQVKNSSDETNGVGLGAILAAQVGAVKLKETYRYIGCQLTLMM